MFLMAERISIFLAVLLEAQKRINISETENCSTATCGPVV